MLRRPDSPVLLFDIDGTLIQSAGGAHLRAMADGIYDVTGVEIPVSIEGSAHYFSGHHIDGLTNAEIFRLVLQAHLGHSGVVEALPALCDASTAYFRTAIKSGELLGNVIPGARETLQMLRNTGAPLGILTGGIRAIATAKLEVYGLGELFTFGGFGDWAFHRYELFADALNEATVALGRRPEIAQVVYVGDTTLDVDAAKRVGAQVVGVATGSFCADDLAAAGADAVFASVEDAQSALVGLFTHQ